MKIYPVPPPYAIQIELVEGCSLACSFCGISSIRANGADADLGVHGKNSAPYKFMTSDTLRRLLSAVADAGWNPRIEFAMHGEPSMHPQAADMVRDTRRLLPAASIQFTTNGSGLLTAAKVRALFGAGLNTLAFDSYVHAPWRDRALAALVDAHSALGIPLFRYPESKDKGNPHTRFFKQRIVVIKDISVNTTGNHLLTNQGGNSFAGLRKPLAARCAKPFRELSVRWDGNVALCCDDWKGVYKVGDVVRDNIEDLWCSPAFEAARRRLYAKDRGFGPCTGCNVASKRVGLLPDKLGKDDMLPPDAQSESYLRLAMRGRVFSIKEMK